MFYVGQNRRSELVRTTYHDGRPDDEPENDPPYLYRRSHWEAVGPLPVAQLRFGSSRVSGSNGRDVRPKGVDTLIAVHKPTVAFDRLYPQIILVAGDADFLPFDHEVQWRGVIVVVASGERGPRDHRRAAEPFFKGKPPLAGNGYQPRRLVRRCSAGSPRKLPVSVGERDIRQGKTDVGVLT